jgi:penicillin-binding protein 2
MDIFDGYASGAQLSTDERRQPRGNIYDRNRELLVEQGGTVTELYVAQNEMSDYEGCLTLLADVLRQQRGDLVTMLNRYSVETIVPLGDVDPEEFAIYNQDLTNLCSIRTDSRETRRYVGHGSVVHVTGFVGQIQLDELESYERRGYTADDLVGRNGIEIQYEAELAGEASRVLRITEPGGLLVRELAGAEGAPPQSVTLTLDRNLQLAAAQALADAYNYAEGNWANREHSTGGGVVVLDIHTGAVLALASFPMFDPGIFNPDTPIFNVGEYTINLGQDVRQPYLNRVIQNSYAPGSTFKIVTTAAAAATGVQSPDEIFYCPRIWTAGREQYGDSLPERFDWRNFEGEEFNFDTGEVTMAEALTASCNPFFYEMGALLFDRGASTLRDYAVDMGLGNRTGFDMTLPSEAAGHLEVPLAVDAAISQAIGQQDTQVTILQMARMVAGVANGGTLYEPYIVQSVGVDGESPTFVAEPQIAGDMGLSAEVLDIVRQGMCMVTDRDVIGRTSGEPLGTAWFVFDDPNGTGIAPYTVCGKTGTAQTGEIEPHGWFVAFAPADNPQIAIAAMIEYSREGSETAAPIVRRILDTYFNAPPAPYPWWWFENEYVPLNIPEGSTGV